MTQMGAARFFGVDGRQSRRWASGQWDAPLPVIMVLALMVRFRIEPDNVRKIANLPPVKVGDMRFKEG
jgi:hypothetical protein